MSFALLTVATLGCQQRDTVAPEEATACTKEAKICPDGSSVSRVGPACEFEACPGEHDPVSADDAEDDEDERASETDSAPEEDEA